jgi:hypothetical protein
MPATVLPVRRVASAYSVRVSTKNGREARGRILLIGYFIALPSQEIESTAALLIAAALYRNAI